MLSPLFVLYSQRCLIIGKLGHIEDRECAAICRAALPGCCAGAGAGLAQNRIKGTISHASVDADSCQVDIAVEGRHSSKLCKSDGRLKLR